MDAKVEKELRDRLRRIETRLTRFMEAQGFETETEPPRWLGVDEKTQNGVVSVPTDRVALSAIKAVVPADWPTDEQITVTCKGEFIVALFVNP